MQNLNLTATALRLGAVNLGGFIDDELAGLLCLDVENEVPLYATAIGHRSHASVGHTRQSGPVTPAAKLCA